MKKFFGSLFLAVVFVFLSIAPTLAHCGNPHTDVNKVIEDRIVTSVATLSTLNLEDIGDEKVSDYFSKVFENSAQTEKWLSRILRKVERMRADLGPLMADVIVSDGEISVFKSPYIKLAISDGEEDFTIFFTSKGKVVQDMPGVQLGSSSVKIVS